MTKDTFTEPDSSNKFCKLGNLRNESDVEQILLRPLLEQHGFTEDYLETKSTIKEANTSKQKKKRPYKPDFGYSDKRHERPVLIVACLEQRFILSRFKSYHT